MYLAKLYHMEHQELLCIQKARLLHKDWSMRLEALSNGLPVDVSNLEDVVNDTFMQDIQVLCDNVESCPCFSDLKAYHKEVRDLVMQLIAHPTGKKAPPLTDIISKMNAMLDMFDEMERWVEAKANKVTLQLKPKEKPAQVDSVMDTLEKSTQDIEEMLRRKP